MPYISNKTRFVYGNLFPDIHSDIEIEKKGDLEYLVFKLMKKYMKNKEYRYSVLHDCVYAVQHCADEFRRRYLDKREDEAREQNGDIK